MLRLLHISDLHFGKSVTFDQDQVQKALTSYVEDAEEAFHGLLITGDVAYSGRASEYVLAEKFFRPLVDALAIAKDRVVLCAGNHDVDRERVGNLARTLRDTEHSDHYFTDGQPCIHITEGQREFGSFYERLVGRPFFKSDSMHGPLVISEHDVSVELWEMNTSIFSKDDEDHGKLWVGRSSVSKIAPLTSTDQTWRFLVGHHPLEWLASEDESRVRALIEQRFNAYLRGHLHQGGYAATNTGTGNLIQISAGSLYQGANRPIECNIVEVFSDRLVVKPMRYVDDPLPAWVPDNGKLGPSAAMEIVFPRVEGEGHVLASAVNIVRAKTFSYPQLFVNADDDPIFVEPRICDTPFCAVTPDSHEVREIPVSELLCNRKKVQIEVPTEHGATTLAHYLAFRFEKDLKVKAEVCSARSIPNYRTKLEKFLNSEVDKSTTAIIVDDVVPSEHKKMIEALVSLGRFDRVIAISPAPQFNSLRDLNQSRNLFDVDPYHAWPLDRARLRSLAIQVFNPRNEEDVSFAVEKTYFDLVSLAIPLTPTNLIMYLHILRNEGDFVPLDRVSIIQKYIGDALMRSSDQISTDFGVRDRIALLAAFVFDLFMLGKTNFSRTDWRAFCKSFQERTLSEFDVDAVLEQLLRARVILDFGSRCFVRYAFVYDFLVGLHAASSPEKLLAFLQEGHHRRLPRVVEVMAAVALDPSPLIDTLQNDLDRHLDEFQAKYVSEAHDPVAGIEWKVSEEDGDQRYWKAIESQMEEGPAPSGAIDKVKESVLAESRSADQEVLIQDYSALEIDLFQSSNAMQSAVRVAVNLDGERKLSAIRSILRTELIVLQVATAFSKQIALSSSLHWGGLLFINTAFDPDKGEDDFGDIVPAVVFGIDLSICEVLAEKLGTKRLGSLYKAALQRLEGLTEFESFNLFSLILRTKPKGWDEELSGIIEGVDYKKWRQNSFVRLLMYDYKNEPNTVESKAKIKHLVALVEAKRSFNKKSPGAKSVDKMQRHLEKKGQFDRGEEGP